MNEPLIAIDQAGKARRQFAEPYRIRSATEGGRTERSGAPAGAGLAAARGR